MRVELKRAYLGWENSYVKFTEIHICSLKPIIIHHSVPSSPS